MSLWEKKDTPEKIKSVIYKDTRTLIKKMYRSMRKVRPSPLLNALKKDPLIKSLECRFFYRKGMRFEKVLQQKLNLELKETGYCYRNQISRFGFQPFDLCVFFKSRGPVLVECMRSDRKDGLVFLESSSRRYTTYFRNMSKIEELVKRTGSPLVFAFLKQDQVFFVPHYALEPSLIAKKKNLSEQMYERVKDENVLEGLLGLLEKRQKLIDKGPEL